MPAYRLAIPPHVAERIRHLPSDLKRGMQEAIRKIGSVYEDAAAAIRPRSGG